MHQIKETLIQAATLLSQHSDVAAWCLDFCAVMSSQYHHKQAMTQPYTSHTVIFLWTSVITSQ